MNLQLLPREKDAIIWQDGDYLDLRSGTLCITRSEQNASNTACKYVHLIFTEHGARGDITCDMTISGDFPNGPTLMILIRRGQDMYPFGLISMTNRAWVHQAPIFDNKLYRSTARYRRFAEPPAVSALGVFAQIAWHVGKAAFTNQDQEMKSLVDTVHAFMHRIATSAESYWQGAGGQVAGKL